MFLCQVAELFLLELTIVGYCICEIIIYRIGYGKMRMNGFVSHQDTKAYSWHLNKESLGKLLIKAKSYK